MELNDLPKVSFGLVNCNRLYYLQSCLESLEYCTKDYKNKEIFVFDNASIEKGTDEYLLEIEKRGIKVHKTQKRNPANEYAIALNRFLDSASGEYICPLAGDMQFIVEGGWLERYVSVYEKFKNYIGNIMFDAQRIVTHNGHVFGNTIFDKDFSFVFDYSRPPIAGSANVMFHKDNIKIMEKWTTRNDSHEGGGDMEEHMLNKVKSLKNSGSVEWSQLLPMFPTSIAIYTDPRGTNARVRGNKIYGKYWKAKKAFNYYETYKYDEVVRLLRSNESYSRPFSIEQVAKTCGWDPFLDEKGVWLKNPIRPENCSKDDYIDLEEGE